MMGLRPFLFLSSVGLLLAHSAASRLSRPSQSHHHHRHRQSLREQRIHLLTELDDEQYAAALFHRLVRRHGHRAPWKRKTLSLASTQPADFPVAHPIVRKALAGMGDGLATLKEKRKERKEDQQRLERSANVAVAHMSDAVSMQHEMVRMKAELRLKDQKLAALENEEGGLRDEHSKLHDKLKAAMEPRIFTKKERLSKQESALSKTEKDLASWKAMREQYRDAANEKLKERKRTLTVLRQSEDAVKEAEHKRQEADDKYEEAKREARKGVEQYKYADVKYGAEVEKDKTETEEVRKDREALASLASIFKMEEQRIDESLFFAKDRLQTRIKQAKAARVKTEELLGSIQKQYGAWEEEEEKLAQQAAREKEAYGRATAAYADERRNVLRTAQEAASARAESTSDWAWDDWAWPGDLASDFADVEEVPVHT